MCLLSLLGLVIALIASQY